MTNEEKIQKTVLDTIKKRKNNENIKEVNVNGLPNNMKPEQKIQQLKQALMYNNINLKALIKNIECDLTCAFLQDLINYNSELIQNK